MPQMIPYRCGSQECREAEAPDFHLAKGDPVACPKCLTTRPGLLTKLETIHLLLPVSPDKKGDIPDLAHDWNFGCEASRKVGVKGRQHLTKVSAACNCLECLANVPKDEDEE